MRIDLQVAAHLGQQIAANFLLPILQGGEFFTEVKASMAALASVSDEFTGNLLPPGSHLHPPLKFGAFHKL